MIMEFSRVSELWFSTIKTGIPVRFTWTQENQTKNWVGYISTIHKTVNKQRENIMTIHAVGSTYSLKDRVTRVFQNTSIPQAVGKIAKEHGFNFITKEHPRRFEQLNLAGHSYWEWIQSHAKKIGYGVVIDGMNFIFKPLDELINDSFSYAPILSMSNSSIPVNTQFKDDTLESFKVLNGEHIESASELRMVKNTGGVNPVTSKSFVSTKNPGKTGKSLRDSTSDVLFKEHKTGSVVNDQAGADFSAEGSAQMARLNLPASVKAQGDPRLRPFGVVLISGTGPLSDGFWVVKEITHILHIIGDYQAVMTVVTDGVGTSSESSFRKRDTSTVGTVNLNGALANRGKQIGSFSEKDVVLSTPSRISNANNQGYKRTPSVWKQR
jgi:phage protein D